MSRLLVTDDIVAMIDRRNAELTALRAENAALRDALRGTAIFHPNGKETLGCDVCLRWWKSDGPEDHAPGCLAAPRSEG